MPMTSFYYSILFVSVRTYILDGNEYQWSERMWRVCDIHRLNQFDRIVLLMKIDTRQEFEIDEKQSKHQIWQQVDNTIYILCAHQQK